MANRQMVMPGIGTVVLAKRRGARNIRISLSQSGQVRVAMPHWVPYAAGLHFLKKHETWIKEQQEKHSLQPLQEGHRVGRQHLIKFKTPASGSAKTTVKVSSTAITVTTPLEPSHPELQRKLVNAAERALKQEAIELLPPRLARISQAQNLPYRGLRIRKLTSRWGSCSSKRDIALSYYLVQLPDDLVDYVLLHELAHTVHHNHSREFWSFVESRTSNLRELRRRIKQFRPRVEPLQET
jgi:predicted metal-dependent hydrolase